MIANRFCHFSAVAHQIALKPKLSILSVTARQSANQGVQPRLQVRRGNIHEDTILSGCGSRALLAKTIHEFEAWILKRCPNHRFSRRRPRKRRPKPDTEDSWIVIPFHPAFEGVGIASGGFLGSLPELSSRSQSSVVLPLRCRRARVSWSLGQPHLEHFFRRLV